MENHPPSNDLTLIQRVIEQDDAALAMLYDKYGAHVYGTALHILRNQVLAEEATQDTFMKVWKQSNRWDPERGQLKTWLMTIARYTAIDRLRAEKRESPWTAIGLDDMLNLIGQSNVIDDNIWFDAKQVEGLLKHLSTEQREAINLAFINGMSHSEIASKLRTPLGTIKSRIRDGLQMLKGLCLHESE